MSFWGKVGYFVSGLSLLILAFVVQVFNIWINFLYIPMALVVLGVLAAWVIDHRFYLEFLRMRTTKHGMNMGVMIVLTLSLLAAVNYLSLRNDKTFDFTEERLNTLSEQTLQILGELPGELTFRVFYAGSEAQPIRDQLRPIFQLYREANPRLRVLYHDAQVESQLAREFLSDLAPREQSAVMIIVDYEGRRLAVESPMGEQEITSALIRASRSVNTKIYFLSGHGQPELDDSGPMGLSTLVQSLRGMAFEVETLSLIQQGAVPEDATIVAVVGPRRALLDEEIELLSDFALGGGRLVIAADPGQRHNIGLLTTALGVEFANNFVINDTMLLRGRGADSVIGAGYDPDHPVTRSFRSVTQVDQRYFSLFDQVSEVSRSPEAEDSVEVTELVRSVAEAYSVEDLALALDESQTFTRRPHALLVESTGDEFVAIVAGDSDFMLNRGLFQGVNRDLALNIFSHLAEQSDLVSIRPRMPAGSTLTMTQQSSRLATLLAVLLPLLLVIYGSVVWFRRRGA